MRQFHFLIPLSIFHPFLLNLDPSLKSDFFHFSATIDIMNKFSQVKAVQKNAWDMLTLIKSMIEFLFSHENQLIFQLQHLGTNSFDELRTRSLKNDTNEWYAHFSEKHVAQLCCLEHKNNGDNWTCRCNRNVNFYFNSSTNLHIQIAKLLWPIEKQLTKPSQDIVTNQ